MKWSVTYTDTFGGEANFCWAYQYRIETPEDASRLLVMRRAKAAAGLNGVRGVTEEDCSGYTFRPHGMNTILFVEWEYE